MSVARALYGYQQRAATWFYERDAAFLVAPLGAGKGAAALTALAELIRDGHRGTPSSSPRSSSPPPCGPWKSPPGHTWRI